MGLYLEYLRDNSLRPSVLPFKILILYFSHNTLKEIFLFLTSFQTPKIVWTGVTSMIK